jgi:hypothetical protein
MAPGALAPEGEEVDSAALLAQEGRMGRREFDTDTLVAQIEDTVIWAEIAGLVEKDIGNGADDIRRNVVLIQQLLKMIRQRLGCRLAKPEGAEGLPFFEIREVQEN